MFTSTTFKTLVGGREGPESFNRTMEPIEKCFLRMYCFESRTTGRVDTSPAGLPLPHAFSKSNEQSIKNVLHCMTLRGFQ